MMEWNGMDRPIGPGLEWNGRKKRPWTDPRPGSTDGWNWVGNFYGAPSIVLIFAPILFPVAMKLGIESGAASASSAVVNMEVGMCHPPVGLNLYVASASPLMGITELDRGR